MKQKGQPLAFYRAALECSNAALVVVGVDGIVRYHSPAAASMLRGPGNWDLTGARFPELFKSDQRTQLEKYLRELAAWTHNWTEASCVQGNGDERWIVITGVNPVAAPEVGGMVLTLSDRTAETTLHPLRGLGRLGDRSAMLANLAAWGSASIVMIDLDEFGCDWEHYRPAESVWVADATLAAVADRLRSVFAAPGSVFRTAREQFVAVMPGTELDAARSLAETALVWVQAPIADDAMRVSASLGVAERLADEDSEDALARADAAMRAAKLGGGGTIAVNDGSQHDPDPQGPARETVPHSRPLSLPSHAEYLERVDAHARESGAGYAIAVCDIDGLRYYNERYGHGQGDVVIRRVADALRSAARPGDMTYLWGAAFILVLPETHLGKAAALGERLRSAVEALAIAHAERPAPSVVSISVGVAEFDPRQHAAPDEVVDAAHRCVDAAKQAGGNRLGLITGDAVLTL